MTREAKMKELQMLDTARRKFMNFTQQQKEAELARLDDDIRQKVGVIRCCLHLLMDVADLVLYVWSELPVHVCSALVRRKFRNFAAAESSRVGAAWQQH